MSEQLPPPLFFDDSDEEPNRVVDAPLNPEAVDDIDKDARASAAGDVLMDDASAVSASTHASSKEEPLKPSAPSERLFFADSDEDMDEAPSTFTHAMPHASVAVPVEDDDDLYAPIPAVASSQASTPSSRYSPDIEIIEPVLPPRKKRRVSPTAQPNSSSAGTPSAFVKSEAAKPVGSSRFRTTPVFLGSFVCGNAFSAVKGKGYTKPGEAILVTRDDAEDEPYKPSKSGGKKPDAKGKSSGKKQLTLTTLVKPAPKAKKKVDTIVRVTNPRGFGMSVSCAVTRLLLIISRVRASPTGGLLMGVVVTRLRFDSLLHICDVQLN
jgi:DNA repair protein RAD5